MTSEELADDLAITAVDLSAKVREAILSGNSAAAEQWSCALNQATDAWREAREMADVV